jgi:NAD(P)H-nitrite reductase large subunit
MASAPHWLTDDAHRPCRAPRHRCLDACRCPEQTAYLERTCHYVARVGLDYVKSIVVDNAERRAELYERLLYSLQGYADPWAEAVATKSKEYVELEAV